MATVILGGVIFIVTLLMFFYILFDNLANPRDDQFSPWSVLAVGTVIATVIISSHWVHL